MSATSGYYAPAGEGWRLAYSLVTLAHELADVYGDQLTCLGTVGDAVHATENMESDHNPFIRDPAAPSIGIVRAIDFGGDNTLLQSIRAHIWALYAETDSRVYEYGYSKGTSDNLINGWGLPFSTHIDTGDAGHLHISVTQVNGNNPSPSGYDPAIDSTAPWGFATTSPEGDGTSITEDDMAQPGWYATDEVGNAYIVDHDLKSKFHLPDAASVAAIQELTTFLPTTNTGGAGWITVKWPKTLLDAIPNAEAS